MSYLFALASGRKNIHDRFHEPAIFSRMTDLASRFVENFRQKLSQADPTRRWEYLGPLQKWCKILKMQKPHKLYSTFSKGSNPDVPFGPFLSHLNYLNPIKKLKYKIGFACFMFPSEHITPSLNITLSFAHCLLISL